MCGDEILYWYTAGLAVVDSNIRILPAYKLASGLVAEEYSQPDGNIIRLRYFCIRSEYVYTFWIQIYHRDTNFISQKLTDVKNFTIKLSV